jgi:hypothetical protein
VRRIDDCEPSPEVLLEIRRHADALLKKAGAYDKFPTPTADLVAAAGLRVEKAFFTDERILRHMDAAPADRVKRARDELLGVVDIRGRIIYVRPEILLGNLPPLVLHETAHAYLAWQHDIYLFVQEDGAGLSHNVKDQFEREANRFAWELVFQVNRFRDDAEHEEFSLRTPVKLSRRYGTSRYAAIRWFVETNRRPCALLVWSRSTREGRQGWFPRRPVQSSSFTERFGEVPSHGILVQGACGGSLAGAGYGARYQFPLPNLEGRPIDCEAQSLASDRHHFTLVYPERVISTVVLSR